MIVENLKERLCAELSKSASVWIASALISRSGWEILQANIPADTDQHFLIGTDLSTPPMVFEALLAAPDISARVFGNQYNYHPKVYIIQRSKGQFVAFVGSANTTNWGLAKNVEMNYEIRDQKHCKKLLQWFRSRFHQGHLITPDFVTNYQASYKKAAPTRKKLEKEEDSLRKRVAKGDGQFFKDNHHAIFAERYHDSDLAEVFELRKDVRRRFLDLHRQIYPRFKEFGLTDLHCHHSNKEIVSRHYPNPFSGKTVESMWLHYGKSKRDLEKYSGHGANSFINHCRLQCIIHEASFGIWLVLGKHHGSHVDREHFRGNMQKPRNLTRFLGLLHKLNGKYWISSGAGTHKYVKSIKSVTSLKATLEQESITDYFIIGWDIDKDDKRISADGIQETVLSEYKKLYSLYLMMRHKE